METRTVDPEACLPDALRDRAPVLTPIASGMSGAAVYRVDAGGEAYVLRLAGPLVDAAAWRRQLAIERRAADAGVAPAVVHVDDARRAVVSAFVGGPPVTALLANPATRPTVLERIGRSLRTLHALPVPDDARPAAVGSLLARAWPEVRAHCALPAFADAVVAPVLEAPPPDDGRAPVLSHNDPNPTNLAWDGERVLLLDWDTAGPGHPLYDLAVVALFLRLDDAATLALLSAHAGEPVAEVPRILRQLRAHTAAVCGALIVCQACREGFAGDASATLETAPSLGDIYARVRTGELDLRSRVGRWQFGLALFKESVALAL